MNENHENESETELLSARDALEGILSDRDDHKKISRCALIVLIVYGPLFCFFSLVALLSLIIYESAISPFFTWLTILGCFAIPISIAVTIIKVCCGNWKGKYKKCIIWTWLPVAMIVGLYLCGSLISWLIKEDVTLILK